MTTLLTDASADAFVGDLEQQVPALMHSARVPGLSLALIRGAEVVRTRAFGVLNAESQEPVTPESVFEAASLTKPVFAYAALKLCEAGILDLDASLAGYLPEPHDLDDPRVNQITMRHCLSHTCGFPNWRPKGRPLTVHSAPGERFSYSGEGYMYLQAVVAHVTGNEPAEHLQANLLDHLGMTHSRLVWTGDEGLAVAVGHDDEGKPQDKALWSDMMAAASLHCTPTDFARFMCAVMRPSGGNAAHLSPAMTKQMLTPQVQVNDSAPWHDDWPKPEIKINDQVAWGLGWGLQRTSLGDAIWHWGDNGNYRAFALGFPEGGDGVVIMTNGRNGQDVITRILRDLVGGDVPGLTWLLEMFG